MFAQQTSINVTSHNIANAGTEGYSRQQARLSHIKTNNFNWSRTNWNRSNCCSNRKNKRQLLDFQIRRRAVSNKNMEEMKQKYLSEIESIYNEPGIQEYQSY